MEGVGGGGGEGRAAVRTKAGAGPRGAAAARPGGQRGRRFGRSNVRGTHCELLPEDKGFGLALGIGLAREVGGGDLLELRARHCQVDPLVAKGVAQRPPEGGDIHKPVVAPIVRVHEDADVEGAGADDGGHAVPDRLPLRHPHRLQIRHVPRHRSLGVQEALDRRRGLIRPYLEAIVPVLAALDAGRRGRAEDVASVAVREVVRVTHVDHGPHARSTAMAEWQQRPHERFRPKKRSWPKWKVRHVSTCQK